MVSIIENLCRNNEQFWIIEESWILEVYTPMKAIYGDYSSTRKRICQRYAQFWIYKFCSISWKMLYTQIIVNVRELSQRLSVTMGTVHSIIYTLDGSFVITRFLLIGIQNCSLISRRFCVRCAVAAYIISIGETYQSQRSPRKVSLVVLYYHGVLSLDSKEPGVNINTERYANTSKSLRVRMDNKGLINGLIFLYDNARRHVAHMIQNLFDHMDN